jgi:tetratricopeptide (TPR) repeat protein
MSATLNPTEKAQLEQTIEMFEVITQSQPQDYQSLEILKEAYSKLSRDADVVKTSKRIAEAYVQLGQLSSAILEYETILQRFPGDPDVQGALNSIESRANNFAAAPQMAMPSAGTKTPGGEAADGSKAKAKPKADKALAGVDDGRAAMHKIFVESKVISAGDFDLCWSSPDPHASPEGVIEPFVQILADKGVMPVDKSLKLLVEKSRLACLPLEKYDIDADLTRKFPADLCRRWCVLPFDRMSKTIMVATANPYNKQVMQEISAVTENRVVWYLASPMEIVKCVRKVFR